MDSLTLWNPRVSLGELQNQAYGYLFPQGLYFAGADAAGVAGWVSERAWSVLVLVLACEGIRRLARAMMLDPWGAAVAGLFYGLSPRIVAEMGVRSAEMLPTAVIPWALIPVVHAATGRRSYRPAALLSGAAFAFSGGVNGTATLAPLPIVGIFVVWMALRRDVPWTFLLWWGGAVAAVSSWWLVSLLTLGRYSPPFFDYVEDAQTTTTTTGFAPSMRGASNWVNYIVVGDSAWWPAGHDVSLNPWIVLGSGLVAAVGLIGLARYRGVFQAPLLVSPRSDSPAWWSRTQATSRAQSAPTCKTSWTVRWPRSGTCRRSIRCCVSRSRSGLQRWSAKCWRQPARTAGFDVFHT